MNNKKSLVVIFFKTMFITMSILAVVCAGLYFGYNYFFPYKKPNNIAEKVVKNSPQNKGENIIANFFSKAPKQVNFLLLGTDKEGSRTDFIVAGCFRPEEGTLSLVSLPRDAKVQMPKDRLTQALSYAPSDGIMKLCEVNHFSGDEKGTEFTKKQVEELLGIKFDYYAKFNLEAFKYIVDKMGGVEFDVPQRMYYKDPVQGLSIDLRPGIQVLNGEQAEGLVRYRKADIHNPKSPGYENDTNRMEVQQNFIKAMLTQMMKKENITNNIPAVVTAFYNYIQTDFDISEAPKFLKYAKNFNPNNVSTYTISADNKRINGKSYEIINKEEKDKIVHTVFFDEEEKSVAEISSKGKNIQVLNGGFTSGMAKKIKEKLEAQGFSIDNIGDFSEEKNTKTRIIVKKDGQGQDIASYFKDAVVEVNPQYSEQYDIVIIIGSSE